MEVYRYTIKSYKIRYQTEQYEDMRIMNGKDLTQALNYLITLLKKYGDTITKIIEMEEL
jgi:hypothetical protein